MRDSFIYIKKIVNNIKDYKNLDDNKGVNCNIDSLIEGEIGKCRYCCINIGEEYEVGCFSRSMLQGVI